MEPYELPTLFSISALTTSNQGRMSEIQIQLRINLPSLQEWSCLILMTAACGIAILASHTVPGRKQGFHAQRMTQAC